MTLYTINIANCYYHHRSELLLGSPPSTYGVATSTLWIDCIISYMAIVALNNTNIDTNSINMAVYSCHLLQYDMSIEPDSLYQMDSEMLMYTPIQNHDFVSLVYLTHNHHNKRLQ